MMMIIQYVTFNFLSSTNDISVENCLCPKWLLCESISDNLRYRAAFAGKLNIVIFKQKKIKNIIFFVFWKKRRKVIFGFKFFLVIFGER